MSLFSKKDTKKMRPVVNPDCLAKVSEAIKDHQEWLYGDVYIPNDEIVPLLEGVSASLPNPEKFNAVIRHIGIYISCIESIDRAIDVEWVEESE